MRNLTNSLAAVGPMSFSLTLFMLLLVPLSPTGRVEAQSKTDRSDFQELYERIASLDAALFDAYNACDIDKVGTFFTEDLEFYHEKGGLLLTRKSTLDTMRANLCGANSNRVRRELVKGSLEVRPINNYGAVQTGEHRFHLTQKGQTEKPDGVGKFVMLWRQKDGEWRISRVVSYGFRPPE